MSTSAERAADVVAERRAMWHATPKIEAEPSRQQRRRAYLGAIKQAKRTAERKVRKARVKAKSTKATTVSPQAKHKALKRMWATAVSLERFIAKQDRPGRANRDDRQWPRAEVRA
jgi:hypothetical protein